MCGEMKKMIALCEEEYEKAKGDAYRSITRANKLETLQTLYERFKEGGSKEEMREELSRRLTELEEMRDHEEEYPSFSWYGDHYHYMVLAGACDAYQSAIELLKTETEEKAEDETTH